MRRRQRGEGSVYQRKSDGLWVGKLDLGNIDGKRRNKIVYGKTQRQAVAKLNKVKQDHANSALVLDSPTVEQWLRAWRDDIAAEKIRPSTMKGYNAYIEQHIIPRVGKTRLDRLEPGQVRKLYADMRKPCPEPDLADNCPHRPSHGLAEASIRQTHAILSRALKVAMREGKVARNVCQLIDPPSTHRNPRQPFTVHQARLVLKAAAGDRYESRWYAALWLGMRQGEALALSWADVNFDEGYIYVHRALQRVKGRGLVFVEPKSRKAIRRIPVPPTVMSRLQVDWARHVAAGGTRDALVWSNDGKPVDPARDYKNWGMLLAKADVPYIALHAARNTTGSLLMAAGVPDKVISEILGHSTVQITQEHYQRGDVEQHRAAMLALERYSGD